jgi:hypothetical protein
MGSIRFCFKNTDAEIGKFVYQFTAYHMTIQRRTLEQYILEAKIFRSHYDLVRIIKPVASNKKNLRLRRDRTSRFCDKSGADTRFRMEAHLLPEMLGNKLLYSEFECDHCNEYFKTLENDLPTTWAS